MTTKKATTAAPYVYNQCGHRLISYRLSYLGFFEECERRYKVGQHQTSCPACGLFVFPDELIDLNPEYVNKLPL